MRPLMPRNRKAPFVHKRVPDDDAVSQECFLEAYRQFWRRPDAEDIEGEIPERYDPDTGEFIEVDPCVRYFVYDQLLEVESDERRNAVIRKKGRSCWRWSRLDHNFSVLMEGDPEGSCREVSAATAVVLAMHLTHDMGTVWLQRVPGAYGSFEIEEESVFYPGRLFKCNLGIKTPPQKVRKTVVRPKWMGTAFLTAGRTGVSVLYSKEPVEGVETACLTEAKSYTADTLAGRFPYYRVLSEYPNEALFILEDASGEVEYFVNTTICIAYAVVGYRYMRWQDDDFTLPMSDGETELVKCGSKIKVSRADAIAYMRVYDRLCIERPSLDNLSEGPKTYREEEDEYYDRMAPMQEEYDIGSFEE